jgi:hypothetical protein
MSNGFSNKHYPSETTGEQKRQIKTCSSSKMFDSSALSELHRLAHGSARLTTSSKNITNHQNE